MPDQLTHVPPHFLVIVPGWMGSRLKTTHEVVWGDFFKTLRNPLKWEERLNFLFNTLTYSSGGNALLPDGIVDEVVFVPPFMKQQRYGRLKNALERMGYSIDPIDVEADTTAAYTFAYDWRQDNRISAQQLAMQIEFWRSRHPGAKVWILAHSNGGLVARWYIENVGGKNHVERLLLLGSPRDGTPVALQGLIEGLSVMFRDFKVFDVKIRSRNMIHTFPSIYQLLPHIDPFLRNVDNENLNVFEGTSWLDEKHHDLLQDGLRFNQELGTHLSVETLVYYGVQQRTLTSVLVSLIDETRWGRIRWIKTEVGDGTIPRRSALHPGALANLSYTACHDDIYSAPQVLEALKAELVDKYLEPERAFLSTSGLMIILEPDKDVYRPDEDIQIILFISTDEPVPLPVSGADIEVFLEWVQSLPGAEQGVQPRTFGPENIWEAHADPGRYTGSLKAPSVEGYYRLRSVVTVTGKPSLDLEELIAVDVMETRMP